MHQRGAVTLAAGLLLLPISTWAQAANACDLNQDGSVNVVDVQWAVNMTLGLSPCTSALIGPGVCNVVVVQRVTNAILNGACPHTVTLNWTASASSNVTGYNVYRGLTSGGPYTKVNTSLIVGTTYIDINVQAGLTYFYVSTAVDGNNNESAYSNQTSALIPSP